MVGVETMEHRSFLAALNSDTANARLEPSHVQFSECRFIRFQSCAGKRWVAVLRVQDRDYGFLSIAKRSGSENSEAVERLLGDLGAISAFEL